MKILIKVYSYLKRLGYIILEHDKYISNTINITYKDDVDDKLQNNNIAVSSDTNSDNFLFSKKQLTKCLNNFSQKMKEMEYSKFVSSSTFLSKIYKKGVYWFDKIFIVPFSLTFNLETDAKINYFKNRNDYTQPLYNYYDNKNLGNLID